MKTRTWICILGLLVIVALGVWQGLTGDTLYHQTRNMDRAREFVPVIRAKLDGEFRQIRVHEFTAAGGSLLVSGEVATQKDVDRVREIVEHTQPPVEVVYQVIPTNDFR
ncbi:MAG: hypothetical protein WCK57_12290 [Verrucomicrobiae bacterium]